MPVRRTWRFSFTGPVGSRNRCSIPSWRHRFWASGQPGWVRGSGWRVADRPWDRRVESTEDERRALELDVEVRPARSGRLREILLQGVQGLVEAGVVALDEDGLAVKRMQNFTMVMPGETQGCVGCHEARVGTPGSQPDNRGLMAMKRPPSQIEPFVDLPDVFDYPRDIQPICVDRPSACFLTLVVGRDELGPNRCIFLHCCLFIPPFSKSGCRDKWCQSRTEGSA